MSKYGPQSNQVPTTHVVVPKGSTVVVTKKGSPSPQERLDSLLKPHNAGIQKKKHHVKHERKFIPASQSSHPHSSVTHSTTFVPAQQAPTPILPHFQQTLSAPTVVIAKTSGVPHNVALPPAPNRGTPHLVQPTHGVTHSRTFLKKPY